MPSASRRGTAVLASVLALFAAGVACFTAAYLVASTKSRTVQQRWERILGSRQELLAQFPPGEANATALSLERLSAALGIDIVPRSRRDRGEPDAVAVAAHRSASDELFRYLAKQLARTRTGLDPLPSGLEAYLKREAKALEGIRRELRGSEPPRWELRLDLGRATPMPNLLGILNLQRLLLTDALGAGAHGDLSRAQADLVASWQLNRALRDSPFLICQLIHVGVARMQAGVLRHVAPDPAGWRERLAEHNFRQSFLTALAYDAWSLTQEPRSVSPLDLRWRDLPEAAAWTAARPYVRYCMDDVSEGLRVRLSNLAGMGHLCLAELARHNADLDVPIPRWNKVGKLFAPQLGGVLERLARLEHDLELTDRILALAERRQQAGTPWPPALPPSQSSASCPADAWMYEIESDGSITISLSREVEPLATGPHIPTRFTFVPSAAP